MDQKFRCSRARLALSLPLIFFGVVLSFVIPIESASAAPQSPPKSDTKGKIAKRGTQSKKPKASRKKKKKPKASVRLKIPTSPLEVVEPPSTQLLYPVKEAPPEEFSLEEVIPPTIEATPALPPSKPELVPPSSTSTEVAVTHGTEGTSSVARPYCPFPAHFTKAERALQWTRVYDQTDLEEIRKNPNGNFFLCRDIALKAQPAAISMQVKAENRGDTPPLTHIPLPLSRSEFEQTIAAPYSVPKTFNGIFDGNNKTISNFSIPRFIRETEPLPFIAPAGGVGFFSATSEKAVVRNVRLSAVRLQTHGRSGALVGHNKGLISNVVILGRGFIEGDTAENQSPPTWGVGGIAGLNSGRIVSASVGSEFSVRGYWDLGGIVGQCINGSNLSASVEKSVFRGTLHHQLLSPWEPEDSIHTNFGGIAGVAYSCTLQDNFVTGATLGRANSGGIVGRILYRATVSDSTVSGTVLGSKSIGGIVGSIEPAHPIFVQPGVEHRPEDSDIRIINNTFSGTIGGVQAKKGVREENSLGGIIGEFQNVRYANELRTQFPSPFPYLPVRISNNSATGEFDLPTPNGLTTDPSIKSQEVGRNTWCGGLIGSVHAPELAVLGYSFADMKQAKWVHESLPQSPGLQIVSPVLAGYEKYGFKGGTCENVGGIVSNGVIAPFSVLFNKANLPSENFLAEGAQGPRWRFSTELFEALKSIIPSPSELDRSAGRSQEELLKLETYQDLNWKITRDGQPGPSTPSWRFSEGSYPYIGGY